MRSLAAALALTLAAPSAMAQTPASPIDAAAWMVGRWTGEGLGGQAEENWSAPHGGQMVGHFALIKDGAPVFYEIMLIDVQAGGLRLRVKHFNPDFVGWEEKDGWHSFEPVSAAPGDLQFKGLRLRQENGEMLITIMIRERGATAPTEHLLRLRRAD